MEEAAYEYFRRIDELGGMVEAVKQQLSAERDRRCLLALPARRSTRASAWSSASTGYEQPDEEPIEILRIDPALERKQIGRLQATRARRDSGAVEATLAALMEAAAEPDRNLMDPILDCARARVSEGEMVETLQSVFGSYTESPVF